MHFKAQYVYEYETIIIINVFARETVQINKVQPSKTWHDNQAGRLRLQLPFAKT